MAIVAVFHVLWALSVWWPAKDAAEWSSAVGDPDGTFFGQTRGSVGWPLVCCALAALFLAAAALVGSRVGLLPRVGPPRVYRVGAWGVAASFLLRGALGSQGLDDGATYAHWERVLYGPLSVALGLLTLAACILSGAAPGRRQPRSTEELVTP